MVSNNIISAVSKSNKYEICQQKITISLTNERYVLLNSYFFTLKKKNNYFYAHVSHLLIFFNGVIFLLKKKKNNYFYAYVSHLLIFFNGVKFLIGMILFNIKYFF